LCVTKYEPKATLLVVQKRQRTPFFPSPEDADGKDKNVPPGTVVDPAITRPSEVDFYLVSHACIQVLPDQRDIVYFGMMMI
jgi:eukaryotic translation initiation factor 2C